MKRFKKKYHRKIERMHTHKYSNTLSETMLPKSLASVISIFYRHLLLTVSKFSVKYEMYFTVEMLQTRQILISIFSEKCFLLSRQTNKLYFEFWKFSSNISSPKYILSASLHIVNKKSK